VVVVGRHLGQADQGGCASAGTARARCVGQPPVHFDGAQLCERGCGWGDHRIESGGDRAALGDVNSGCSAARLVEGGAVSCSSRGWGWSQWRGSRPRAVSRCSAAC
jgi:hypothetical protein